MSRGNSSTASTCPAPFISNVGFGNGGCMYSVLLRALIDPRFFANELRRSRGPLLRRKSYRQRNILLPTLPIPAVDILRQLPPPTGCPRMDLRRFSDRLLLSPNLLGFSRPRQVPPPLPLCWPHRELHIGPTLVCDTTGCATGPLL